MVRPVNSDGSPEAQELEGFRAWNVPGLVGSLVLPDTITVSIQLTSVGRHRPGRRFQKTCTTYHGTNNFTKGAEGHSHWQDNCTEGHPNGDVGVHAYVENRLIIIKIPFDEECIATGDWRNHAHVSIEECVNANRDPVQTENTTLWLHAAILAARGQNAIEHLFPHTTGAGCPHHIHGAGRWRQIEQEVDRRIAILNEGGTPPPEEEFDEPIPIPREWDGTDYRRPADGHLFMALARIFQARVRTAARISADPEAKKTRADFEPGETFLVHYVTAGSDGASWLVTELGSRIRAVDCAPSLDALAGIVATTARALGEQDELLVMNDPTSGLSAGEVPADAPALSKDEFMRGRE